MPFEAALMAMLVAVERQLIEMEKEKRLELKKNAGVDL